jgi:hypothetical protein
MNIKETFLKLTSRTYPHGSEKDVEKLLPESLNKDEFGNLFIKIGNSDTMFTSHLDTATSVLTTITHVFDNNIIKTDGTTILGADDKAGVTIMLYMIENKVPGLYYFFIGEEVGCIGSKKVANSLNDAKLKKSKILGINKVISFDRRGTDSIITFQSSKRCCSDEFAKALAIQFNDIESTFSYSIDDTGVLTDSVQFINIYPECTNISVGYKNEHTFNEYQDIEHLKKLAKACISIDWDKLPIKRDPSKTEYKKYLYDSYSGWDNDWDTYYPKDYSNRNFNYSKTEKIWFYDEEYDYVSYAEVDKYNDILIKVDLCTERLLKEKIEIYDLLNMLEVDFDSMTWDGIKVVITRDMMKDVELTRKELEEYLPQLDYTKFDKYEENKNDI